MAVFVLFVVIGLVNNGATASKGNPPAPAAAPKASIKASIKPEARVLTCHARPSSRRPRDHTTVRLVIRTVARAWVTAAGQHALTDDSLAGRADAHGLRTVRFRVRGATPGNPLVMVVRVSRGGASGSCRASIRPRRALAPVVTPAAQPSPAPPAPTRSSAPPPPPPASPASCHPLSDEGTCYEPGEFCRDSDHGVTGLAGDGETITCEDNDGWRWEPA